MSEKEKDADEARLDRLDYYTLLGLGRSASPDEVREAFRRFAQRYHPDLYAGQGEDKVRRATVIYRRGTEAYRVLLDPAERRSYDEQLGLGKLRYERNSYAPGEMAKRSIPPQALPTARAAQQALKQGNLPLARQYLLDALAHDPNNTVLRAGLAEVEAKLRGGR